MSCSSSLSVTSGSFVCTFEARKAHWAANEWSSCSVPYASLFHAARLLTCSLFGSGACAKREDNRRTMGGQITDTGKAPAEYMYMYSVQVHVLPEPSSVSSDRVFVLHNDVLVVFLFPQNQTISIYISASLCI